MTSGDSQPDDHADLSVAQVADRLAIRELVDAYAYCADRRDAAGDVALFTPSPTQHIRERAALAPVFDELNTYEATMHFNGQSTTALGPRPPTGHRLSRCLHEGVRNAYAQIWSRDHGGRDRRQR
jgi:uncharacterized protein YerC